MSKSSGVRRSILYLPDGNHRFARIKGISLEEAYYRGGKILETFTRFFFDGGLASTLIFYTLSSYTHKRTDKTPAVMHRVIVKLFREWNSVCFFSEKRINVYIIFGHTQKFPDDLKQACDDLMGHNEAKFEKEIFILLGYSLSEDMNTALSYKPNNYQELRAKLLFHDIDLVIRTTEMRLSNGPVYAMSQSQMITINKMNPEVTTEDLEKLWAEYCRLLRYRISTNIHHK